MSTQTLTLASFENDVLPILFVSLLGAIILTAIVFSNVRKAFETRAKETTRREIAAYVAEGSISPDDARKLLATGAGEELERKIGEAVAWGSISAKKAEGLLRAAREGRSDDAPAGV